MAPYGWDLSPYAGETVAYTLIGLHYEIPWGNFVMNFANAGVLHADGSFTAIYTGQPGANVAAFTGNNGGAQDSTSGTVLVPITDPSFSTEYFADDHLGTAQMEFNGGGWPVWEGQFTPFGKELEDGHTDMAFKFTGKQRDRETDLDNFGARYYASHIARWMSPDWADQPEPVPYSSLDNPQSLNLYGYVGNNPLGAIDLDGHRARHATQHCGGSDFDCELAAFMSGMDTQPDEPDQNNPKPAAQPQSSSGPGFFGRLGQRLNNFFHNNGFVTNAELDQVHGSFTSAYIVPGSFHEIEPNSYVTLGLDAAGIGATLTGHAYAAGGIAAGSSIYDPDPMNLGLIGMSLVPGILGEAAMPLTVVNDAGGLAGGVITNNVMAPMLMSIPGDTMNDGNGHTIPTPEATCVSSGMC